MSVVLALKAFKSKVITKNLTVAMKLKTGEVSFKDIPKVKREPVTFSAFELYQQLPLGGASSLLIFSQQSAAWKARCYIHKLIISFFIVCARYFILKFHISHYIFDICKSIISFMFIE